MDDEKDLLQGIAVAKAKEEFALKLIADEAALLEALKAEARAAAKARGMTDEEVDALFPSYPAGAFGVDL